MADQPTESAWEMNAQQEAADRRSQAEAQAQQPKPTNLVGSMNAPLQSQAQAQVKD